MSDNTDERWFWNGSRDQPSRYTSEAEWCDAMMRRLAWLYVCESPLGANLAIAGALAETWRRAQKNCSEWWAGRAVLRRGPQNGAAS